MKDLRRGALYGQAIGDALGAWYEFSGDLKPGEHARYQVVTKGGNFLPGEWTDDTAQALIVARALSEAGDDPDTVVLLLAEGFQNWLHQDGRGVGNLTVEILTHPLYLCEPLAIAEEIWESSGRVKAPNGGVMRTVGAAIVRPWDHAWTERMSALACKVTHADPRCVASSVAVSCTIAALIRGEAIPAAIQIGIEAGEKHDAEIRAYANEGIQDLRLGARGSIGYTYKCAGAGFWALREFQRRTDAMYDDMHDDRFQSILDMVIREGGDTDTNAAVAGAMMGAAIGINQYWEENPLLTGLKRRTELDATLAGLPKEP